MNAKIRIFSVSAKFSSIFRKSTPIFSPYPCKHYSRMRESDENARKMGKEEIENFPLRVFIFFLKGKYIFP